MSVSCALLSLLLFRVFFRGGGNMHVRLYEFVNVLCIHLSVHGGKTKKSFIVHVNVLETFTCTGRERRCGRKNREEKG